MNEKRQAQKTVSTSKEQEPKVSAESGFWGTVEKLFAGSTSKEPGPTESDESGHGTSLRWIPACCGWAFGFFMDVGATMALF